MATRKAKKKTKLVTRKKAKKKATKRSTKKRGKKKSAKKKRKKKANGRPRVMWTKPDWEKFDLMCRVGVRQVDIAEAFGIDRDTVAAMVRREKGVGFSAYKDQKAGHGRAHLLAKQMELAMAGDKTMLIWLGKNLCGQSDKSTIDTNLTLGAKHDLLRQGLRNPKVRDAMDTLSDNLGLDLDDIDLG